MSLLSSESTLIKISSRQLLLSSASGSVCIVIPEHLSKTDDKVVIRLSKRFKRCSWSCSILTGCIGPVICKLSVTGIDIDIAKESLFLFTVSVTFKAMLLGFCGEQEPEDELQELVLFCCA